MKSEFDLMLEVLDDNNYDYDSNVVEDIRKKSKAAKADLIAKMRQMPGWDEDRQAVIFDTDIIRSIDPEACKEVINWMKEQLYRSLPEAKHKFSEREVRLYVDKLSMKRNYYKSLLDYGEPVNERYSEICKDLEHYREIYRWYNEETTVVNYGKRVSVEDSKKYYDFERATSAIYAELKDGNFTLTKGGAERINTYFPELKLAQGLKISKAFGKLCKLFKLNEIEDWQTDYNGNLKNKGYNYQFAKFGDAVNPLHVPRYVVLSVHGVDFLYMSNGNSWGSCHTIIDGGAWGYRGEYSAGTISYLLDPCSMIFYTVDREFNGDDFCITPKMQRAVFAYNDGVLYEGRVYPDGRDGGDAGYAAQFRSIVQKLFADVEDKANLWTKVSNRYEYIIDLDGCAYHDWEHYDDCNITILNEMETKGKVVRLNATPICIYCGCTHHEEGNINCCGGEKRACDYCGERRDEDDGIWINDNWYCCHDCAYDAGYRWCDDIDEYVYQDDCYCDTRTGEWFYRTDDMVETEDGNIYQNSESAINDDYNCDDNGNWYPADEVYEDAYTGAYFHAESSDDVFEFNGNYYMSLENARANGEEVDAA